MGSTLLSVETPAVCGLEITGAGPVWGPLSGRQARESWRVVAEPAAGLSLLQTQPRDGASARALQGLNWASPHLPAPPAPRQPPLGRVTGPGVVSMLLWSPTKIYEPTVHPDPEPPNPTTTECLLLTEGLLCNVPFRAEFAQCLSPIPPAEVWPPWVQGSRPAAGLSAGPLLGLTGIGALPAQPLP